MSINLEDDHPLESCPHHGKVSPGHDGGNVASSSCKRLQPAFEKEAAPADESPARMKARSASGQITWVPTPAAMDCAPPQAMLENQDSMLAKKIGKANEQEGLKKRLFYTKHDLLSLQGSAAARGSLKMSYDHPEPSPWLGADSHSWRKQRGHISLPGQANLMSTRKAAKRRSQASTRRNCTESHVMDGCNTFNTTRGRSPGEGSPSLQAASAKPAIAAATRPCEPQKQAQLPADMRHSPAESFIQSQMTPPNVDPQAGLPFTASSIKQSTNVHIDAKFKIYNNPMYAAFKIYNNPVYDDPSLERLPAHDPPSRSKAPTFHNYDPNQCQGSLQDENEPPPQR